MRYSITMTKNNETIISQKADEIPPQYIAKNVEPHIRSIWDNAFHANPKSTKPTYTIMMPPPNVTGVLHMGHALVNTLQDILIRWKKMMGYEVLWMPGTDHAGIATQTVVERHLIKTEGKRRTEYSRDDFLQKVWEWKEKSQSVILNQLKILGCACDWKRLRFSMDDTSNKAVRHMFKLLFDKGLIYRGDYLVNWDPVSGTALADDEVEYEDRSSFLYTIRYPILDSECSLFVATTRPETLLGDTAVAVHPKDARYTALIGQKILHPITGRTIPIVGDDFVDPEFGTGVVKITPGHDPNDYQLALRHNLPMINILNPDGTLNKNGLHYEGCSVEDARARIVQELKDKQFLSRIEPHTNRVGVSYRSKAVIEPMLSKQWFIRMSTFKGVLRELVETSKVKIIPKSWENTYFQWIDNLRDWCISRQLWWGHQIPVWYSKKNKEIMVCYDKEGLPPDVKQDPDAWEQDPDVLDTWFSSALWPFSTLGWPDKTEELKRFYPNSTLITGHDILFFWVARMIMMGHVAMQDVPFHETFLHGLIYGKSYWRQNPQGGITYVSEEERKAFDLGKQAVPQDVQSRWEKMSKSKGNVIDPIEVIDEYGADAIRLALASSATDARQIDLDRRRFEEWRNFANKVWNGSRFVLMNILPSDIEHISQETLSSLQIEDRWILSRVERVSKKVVDALTHYSFDKASQEAYEFYWNEFCSYYVELSKPSLFGKKGPGQKSAKQSIALIVLFNAIRILHPFAPYITEEIFSLLKTRYASWISYSDSIQNEQIRKLIENFSCTSLSETSFPQSRDYIALDVENDFSKLQEIVTQIRAIRGEMKIPPSQAIDLFIKIKKSSSSFQLVQNNLHVFESLTKIASSTIIFEEQPFLFSSRAIVGDIELIVPLPSDMRQKEFARLEKELIKLEEQKMKTEAQLSNSQFLERAPLQLISKLQQTLQEVQSAIELLQQQKEALS